MRAFSPYMNELSAIVAAKVTDETDGSGRFIVGSIVAAKDA